DLRFLTGPEASVRRIADAVGFDYRHDAASDQYVHSVGQVIVAGDGTVSSYLLDPGPVPAQLQAALAQAARGEIAGTLDRLLLLCFGEGPQSGRLSRVILAALALINLAGALAATLLFARLRRRPD